MKERTQRSRALARRVGAMSTPRARVEALVRLQRVRAGARSDPAGRNASDLSMQFQPNGWDEV
jgi:hypothetical protein